MSSIGSLERTRRLENWIAELFTMYDEGVISNEELQRELEDIGVEVLEEEES